MSIKGESPGFERGACDWDERRVPFLSAQSVFSLICFTSDMPNPICNESYHSQSVSYLMQEFVPDAKLLFSTVTEQEVKQLQTDLLFCTDLVRRYDLTRK